MSAILLLFSAFSLVFLLGLQSQFVNRGRSAPAFFISFAIGGSNLILFKLAPEASGVEMLAYMTGGPIGIVCAIRAFRWWHNRSTGQKV